jgi:hypothetical protein
MFARRVLKTINPVIAFAREKNLSAQICQEDFLPEASRFGTIGRTRLGFCQWERGQSETLITLYLEDISDFIVEC